MSGPRESYLAEIGITAWRRRGLAASSTPGEAEPTPLPAPTAPATPGPRSGSPPRATARAQTSPAAGATWDALAAAVRACTRCALHGSRTQTVFGVGRRDAELFVIGEAPGADEDRQGEPFVGRAGQLLNAMLRSIGLPRSDVYIANILKCRPPGNRDPQPSEAAECTPYLNRQIELVRPRVILAVGRIAAQWLLQSDAPIGRLRGRVLKFGEAGTPLVITYHPAYLLRSPLSKATAWADLCLVKDLLSS